MKPSFIVKIEDYFNPGWNNWSDEELINHSIGKKMREGEPYHDNHDYWQEQFYNGSRQRALVRRGYPIGVWFIRYNKGVCTSWGQYTEWRIVRKGLLSLDIELNHHNDFERYRKL